MDNSMLERLLEAGSTEMPSCLCRSLMRLSRTEAADRETEIRVFQCPDCDHELRLTVWIAAEV
jgi:transcription initiation factor IIE alpha subunit